MAMRPAEPSTSPGVVGAFCGPRRRVSEELLLPLSVEEAARVRVAPCLRRGGSPVAAVRWAR